MPLFYIVEKVFLYFDRDRNGFIDITEFLVGIRGELNQRRKDLIRMAFNVLDVQRNGAVSVDDLAKLYDTSWHPDVSHNVILNGSLPLWRIVRLV